MEAATGLQISHPSPLPCSSSSREKSLMPLTTDDLVQFGAGVGEVLARPRATSVRKLSSSVTTLRPA